MDTQKELITYVNWDLYEPLFKKHKNINYYLPPKLCLCAVYTLNTRQKKEENPRRTKLENVRGNFAAA